MTLEILVPLVLLVLTGGGYLIKRRIEGARHAESIDKAAKLVALHAGMKEQGLTPESLMDFEKQLTMRRSKLRAIEDAVVIEVESKQHNPAFDSNTEQDEFLSQVDMNEIASESLRVAQYVLDSTLDIVQDEMSESQVKAIWATQRNWKKYAEAQAELVASLVEGGSMQPMIYASELERITIQRIAELEDYIKSRQL